MSLARTVRHLNLRAELRLALLAAAESCWLYAIIFTVGSIAGMPRQVSPVGIFIVYWIALAAGRFLPRLPQRWRVLQILTVITAFLGILIAIRIGLYTDTNILDFSWLPQYLGRMYSLFERASPDELSTFILVIAFVRALSFAQRPLTLWIIGFQFRLGIVIFFALAIVGALGTRVEFTFWIFVFFGCYLISIALARIEDAGQVGKLGRRWAGVMLTMLGVVLLVGFGITQLLTLDAVNAFFAFISPVALLAQAFMLIIALPLIYLLDFVFRALAPLLRVLSDFLTNLFPTQTESNQQPIEFLDTVLNGIAGFAPYLRFIGVILVLLLIGWWVARALNKRMNRVEEEMLERESLAEAEARTREKILRPRPARTGPREIHAENIRRIYAALQAQAELFGLARRDAETPHEFLPRLAAQFPESNADLQTITNAYVAVHYAQQNATDAQVRQLRDVWNRTREQMREHQRKNPKSKPNA